jgi:hypothetical protein
MGNIFSCMVGSYDCFSFKSEIKKKDAAFRIINMASNKGFTFKYTIY